MLYEKQLPRSVPVPPPQRMSMHLLGGISFGASGTQAAQEESAPSVEAILDAKAPASNLRRVDSHQCRPNDHGWAHKSESRWDFCCRISSWHAQTKQIWLRSLLSCSSELLNKISQQASKVRVVQFQFFDFACVGPPGFWIYRVRTFFAGSGFLTLSIRMTLWPYGLSSRV